jgi:hypothetical protein
MMKTSINVEFLILRALVVQFKIQDQDCIGINPTELCKQTM